MISKITSFIKSTMIRNFMEKEIDYLTWIFSSSYNSKFNYNSKYLFEHVLINEPNIKPVYIINDDELRNKLQKKYGKEYFIETRSIKGIKKVLNAGVWFTSAGLPVYGFNLNNDRIIVNLWHGVPLKKIALMENNIRKLTQLYFKNIFSNNYTYILTTSKELIPIMKESFGVIEDKIMVWGQPRNDAIFIKNDRSKVLNSIYKNLPRYEKILLYAPTYREYGKTIFFPFEDFNTDELNRFLEENQLIIFIRCHQSETQGVSSRYGDRVKLINSDKVEEIMDIINIFDILITDYSSIYIDYLLTKKPIIFLPYDKDEYVKLRGLNFDYNSVTPGPKPRTFKAFKDEVVSLLHDSEYYYLEREKSNLFFNDITKPCSETICENIIQKINEIENSNK